MNDFRLQDKLKQLVESTCMDCDYDEPPCILDVDNIRTFKEAEILTNNAGLVVEMTDGNEFQITIVKSR